MPIPGCFLHMTRSGLCFAMVGLGLTLRSPVYITKSITCSPRTWKLKAASAWTFLGLSGSTFFPACLLLELRKFERKKKVHLCPDQEIMSSTLTGGTIIWFGAPSLWTRIWCRVLWTGNLVTFDASQQWWASRLEMKTCMGGVNWPLALRVWINIDTWAEASNRPTTRLIGLGGLAVTRRVPSALP